MSGGVGDQHAVQGLVRSADFADGVRRVTACKAYVFNRNWDGAVGNYAVGSDRFLACIQLWACPSSAEHVAAEQSPEQDNVDDIHDHTGRRDGNQIHPTYTTAPEDDTVTDPDKTNKSAGHEREEICRRVHAVQEASERCPSHLQQLSEVKKKGVDFSEQCYCAVGNVPTGY